ncbi:MAG: septum formation protein Maf [Clostridia bacterium]|nr:septum formation protein Maf [Clostridia bacterium]
MEWILASASPRRRELLGKLIEKFDIIPAKGEEVLHGEKTPEEVVKALAKQKASEVATLPETQGKAVLGSDTVVALDGEILGKPKDEADAARMLSALSGRTHEVYTGVCIIYTNKNGGREILCRADCTKVRFNVLTAEEIGAYIATGSPMDKAGAYGIQDGGLVQSIEGSFSNVVGLPVELCEKMLAEINA